MDKIKVKCINEVPTCFTEGKEYVAVWKSDDYGTMLETIDDSQREHIIAEHSLDDKWFKENFEVIE